MSSPLHSSSARPPLEPGEQHPSPAAIVAASWRAFLDATVEGIDAHIMRPVLRLDGAAPDEGLQLAYARRVEAAQARILDALRSLAIAHGGEGEGVASYVSVSTISADGGGAGVRLDMPGMGVPATFTPCLPIDAYTLAAAAFDASPHAGCSFVSPARGGLVEVSSLDDAATCKGRLAVIVEDGDGHTLGIFPVPDSLDNGAALVGGVAALDDLSSYAGLAAPAACVAHALAFPHARKDAGVPQSQDGEQGGDAA